LAGAIKNNIAIIGFMGTGKTSVGKNLARITGKKFVALDGLIEQKTGKSINDIFRDYGEIYFRELEIAVVKEVAGRQNQVIDCGGGVVLNKINIDRLRETSVIVCLLASPEDILKRLSSKNDRPLLAATDKKRRIHELLDFRQPFYERYGDIFVDTSGKTLEEVVAEVVERLKEYAGFNFQEQS